MAQVSEAKAAAAVVRGTALKNEGNELFKNGQHTEAMRKYHEAVMFVSGLDTSNLLPMGDTGAGGEGADGTSAAATAHTIAQANEIRLQCYTNLAACHGKNQNWKRMKETADKALGINANYAKALFRRGQAHHHLDEIDKAEADMRAVLALEPEEPKAIAELKAIMAKQNTRSARQKQEMAGFLNRFGGL